MTHIADIPVDKRIDTEAYSIVVNNMFKLFGLFQSKSGQVFLMANDEVTRLNGKQIDELGLKLDRTASLFKASDYIDKAIESTQKFIDSEKLDVKVARNRNDITFSGSDRFDVESALALLEDDGVQGLPNKTARMDDYFGFALDANDDKSYWQDMAHWQG